MAGKQFLNPFLKLILCIFGTSLIGFYVYESVISGTTADSIFFVRILVLLGFIYLLFQSAREVIRK